MTRAAVVIIEDGYVALIERNRDGELYYLFPGGHVEAGETLQQAAAREALEELGLEVEVGALSSLTLSTTATTSSTFWLR